jgi:hypothetical protein
VLSAGGSGQTPASTEIVMVALAFLLPLAAWFGMGAVSTMRRRRRVANPV